MPQGYDSPGVAENYPPKKKPKDSRGGGNKRGAPQPKTEQAQERLASKATAHVPQVVQQPSVLDVSVAVNDRASQMPQQVVDRHPGMAASLLVSAVPTSYVGKALETYSTAFDYVAQQTAAAGISGALSPLYSRALALPDPEMRAKAIAFLKAVSNAPEGEQALMLQVLSGARYTSLTGADEEMVAVLQQLAPTAMAGLDTGFGIGTFAHAFGDRKSVV